MNEDRDDRDYIRFIQGKTNVLNISGGYILTRDKVPNRDLDYYSLKRDNTLITEWFGKLGERYKKNKSTGGKKPYVMLMTEKLQEFVKEGKVTVEQIGYLTMLSTYIEWNTGRLIHKRSKKPIQQSEICEMFNISSKTWSRRLKELQENNLISFKEESYFISTELFKKGGSKK